MERGVYCFAHDAPPLLRADKSFVQLTRLPSLAIDQTLSIVPNLHRPRPDPAQKLIETPRNKTLSANAMPTFT
jgi:hypothetical protein